MYNILYIIYYVILYNIYYFTTCNLTDYNNNNVHRVYYYVKVKLCMYSTDLNVEFYNHNYYNNICNDSMYTFIIKLVADIRLRYRRLYNDDIPLPVVIITKPFFVHRCATDEVETPLVPFS